MKKSFLLSVAIIMIAATVHAQTNTSSKKDMKTVKLQEKEVKEERKAERAALRKMKSHEVSNQSKEQFYRDFGNIPGTKWNRVYGNFDQATFTKDGKTMKAFYDDDAELVGTVTEKTFDSLPPEAQKYINDKYKGYTKGEVIFYDDNEENDTDMYLYDSRFDDADNYFVDLKKADKEIVLKVDIYGGVSFFKQLK